MASNTLMRPAHRLTLAAWLTACASAHPLPAPTASLPVAPDAAVTVAPAVAPPPLDTGRLPDTARPLRYALALTIDPSQPEYQGTITIELRVPSPTRTLVMHARTLTIDRAELTVGREVFAAHDALRMAHGGRESPEELVLSFDHEIPAGTASLRMTFHAPWDTGLRGLYRLQIANDWYAFSDFEPTDARRAFPCFDEPAFKTPWELTITAPNGAVAIQNMPETSRAAADATHTTFHFAPTPPLPSYLVAFAVGPFDFFEGPRTPVPVRVVTPRGRAALGSLAAEAAAAHVQILSEYFDRPFPYPKLDLVSVADFTSGAMENPGLITFRDSLLLLDPAQASSRSRMAMASVTAHELAHQWFGDLVTMPWWNDLWLNEGFATWMSTHVMARWRPALGADGSVTHGRMFAREHDGRATAHAIRRPITSTSEAREAFDGITYDKGAAIIAMLEAWMTPERFRDGIRAYIRDHAEGSATADDLLAALTAAGGDHVAEIGRSYLDQPGLPRVSVALQCRPNATATVTLRQSRYAPRGAQEGTLDQRWSIPVCLAWPAPDGAPHERCVRLDAAEQSVELDTPGCPAWIAPNARHTGHYWYDLPPELLRALARSTLTPAARIELQANLEALLTNGSLHADVYLDALSAQLASDDPNVLEASIAALWRVELAMVSDAARPGFERWVAARLGPIARRLTFTPAPGDDDVRRGLRRSVLHALGMLTHDPWARAQSEALAARALREPTAVDADVAAVALSVASRRATSAQFDTLLARVASAPTPQVRNTALGALMSIEDPALHARALALALAPDTRQQDLRVLLGQRGHTPALRQQNAQWALEHFDALRARWAGNPRAISGPFAGLCDAEAIDRTEREIAAALGQMEGAERTFRSIFEADRQCAETRRRDAESAEIFLRRAR